MGWELDRDTNPCREVTDAHIEFWTKTTGSEGLDFLQENYGT